MKWINVNDKLPDIDIWVLIIDSGKEINIAAYRRYERNYQKDYKRVRDFDYAWEYVQTNHDTPLPTHWCALEDIPLPEGVI